MLKSNLIKTQIQQLHSQAPRDVAVASEWEARRRRKRELTEDSRIDSIEV